MLQEAIRVRTPSATRAPIVQAFTAASTAAVATGVATGCDSNGRWFTFLPTQDCHIIFGDATVAAASASSMLFNAGVRVELWLARSTDTHFRVIRDTADGTLYLYPSSD
jgi:hypothetical protein